MKLLLILVIILPVVLSANILFFFAGGNISHKTGVWPWVLALANRGHKVTFLSSLAKTPSLHPNVTDLTTPPLQQFVSQVYQVDRFKERDEGIEKDVSYNYISSTTCKAVVESKDTDPVLQSLLNNSFDLVVVNAIFGECGFYLGHYFKAKSIVYDSCSLMPFYYETYGISPEVAWVPDLIIKFSNIPMTFLDRVYNVFIQTYWSLLREGLSNSLTEITRPLFKENIPTLHELESNASLVFVNSHPSVDFARTLPPLFVDVGGMANWAPTKEIPVTIKNFMDGAGSGGVVLISFGSTVLLNTVASRYQAMFFHLIHEFPKTRFLLRWSGPLPKFLDKAPKNLFVSEWLPQKEILRHPKLKIFITHGGVSSIQESTYHGVPMIVIPLFADQDFNAYRIESHEVGLRIEIRGMSGETLVNAVERVLNDEKYKKNMAKRAAIFKDRKNTPVETAVFWTEFALRHEETSSTFRPNNQHLNWFQRRLIDVYLFYLASALLSLFVSFIILKLLLNLVCSFVSTMFGRKEKREKTD